MRNIVKRGHDIPALLRDLALCEVNLNPYGEPEWVAADLVAKEVVDLGLVHIPILELIGVEGEEYSKFPNGIRYGETVMDVDPSLLATAAAKFCAWARQFHWRIRRKPEIPSAQASEI